MSFLILIDQVRKTSKVLFNLIGNLILLPVIILLSCAEITPEKEVVGIKADENLMLDLQEANVIDVSYDIDTKRLAVTLP